MKDKPFTLNKLISHRSNIDIINRFRHEFCTYPEFMTDGTWS